jgi:hypothetical protein
MPASRRDRVRPFFTAVVLFVVTALTGDVASAASNARVALIGVRTFGVAEQLARRTRAAVVTALRDQSLEVIDLADSHFYVSETCSEGLPYVVHLAPHKVTHVVTLRLEGTAGGRAHELSVSVGSLGTDGGRYSGPWPTTTMCRECGDSEIVEAARLLTRWAWKAFDRASAPVTDITVSARERADKGRALVRTAMRDETSTIDQIYLLKKAVRAGAGAEAFSRLAELFYQAEQWEDAESYALRAAAVGADIQGLLGAVYYATGRWKDAAEILAARLRRDPSNAGTAKVLAEVKRRLASSKDVAAQAEEALARGDAFEAKRLGQMAVAVMGSDPRAYLVVADASMKAGDACDAWAYYQRALDLDPKNMRAASGRRASEESLRREVAKRRQVSGR